MARSSPPLFSVSVTDFANGLVLALHGEIDLAAEPTVTGHVETALAQRPATLVLDLGEVTFFDARGLGALIVATGRRTQRLPLGAALAAPDRRARHPAGCLTRGHGPQPRRLVNTANPGAVLVSDELATAVQVEPGFFLRRLRPRRLRGMGKVRVHVLRRSAEQHQD